MNPSKTLIPHQRGAGFVGGGVVEADVGASGFGEFCADGGAGVERAVAIGAEMAEVEVFHEVGDDFGGDFGGGVVGEMAVPGENALLDRPGTFGVLLQQPQIVVGFEDERPRLADAFDDEFGGVTEVGEEADVAERVIEHESDRIVGVVRHGKAVDFEIAHIDRRARFKEPPVGERGHLGMEIFGGQAVAINGNGMAFGQHGQAADVVAVFVGEENSICFALKPASTRMRVWSVSR